MTFHIITLFPEMFASVLDTNIFKRAQAKKLVQIKLYNLRDYSRAKRRQVDDTPYGGGAGMVMACQPLFAALEQILKKIKTKKRIVIYLSPAGKKLTQIKAEKFTEKFAEIVLICGHYEGIDQRVIDTFVDMELSIGDYVLNGGEIPAMVFLNVVSRLVPGVLGKEESATEESFSKKLKRKKEYPHYTKPAEFRDMKVPQVLLNGHHGEIEKWRKAHLR